MTKDQFAYALEAFCRRRPVRPFLIELTSGNSILIKHPEAIRTEGPDYVARTPDGAFMIFAHDSVVRLLDPPQAK